MTKDLSDMLPDIQEAEKEINKTPAPKEQKLEQTTLPGIEPTPIKLPDGSTKTVAAKTKEKAKKATPAKTDPITTKNNICELLDHFCLQCGHMEITTAQDGVKIVKKYPKAAAWKYLADLCGFYTRCEETKYCNWKNNPSEFRVESRVSLVRKSDDQVVTTVVACAGSDESWVRNKGVSAAYGLAITRAECRAVRSRLGHYMSCVGLEVVPYEEMTDQPFIDLEEV